MMRSRPLRMRRRPDCYGNCHCRDCQRATAAHLPRRFLSRLARLTSRGEVKYYEAIGDSGGIVRRGFCPNCGASVVRSVGRIAGQHEHYGRYPG